MKIQLGAFMAIFFFLSCNSGQRLASNHWKLVWADEFNQDGPIDAAKWQMVTKGRSDWNSFMKPDPSLVYIQNGHLILKAIKTDAGYQTSGVSSRDQYGFKYGKLLVRAKLNAGKGSWPAIWLMPLTSQYGGWPKSGEIDLMERLNFDTMVYQTLHSHYIDDLHQKTLPPYSVKAPFHPNDFNVFGMEWFADRIDFFVNDQKTLSYPRLENEKARMQWPFDQSFYIILNQALGGKWVGSIADTDLPVQMEVDYVRVYQTHL